MYCGASSTQPADIEKETEGYYTFLEDEKEAYRTYMGSANPVCGCCGARQATTMAQFNKLSAGSPSYEYNQNKYTYNRGLLLMVNPVKEEVLVDTRYPVVYIQCGDDVLAVRQRKV